MGLEVIEKTGRVIIADVPHIAAKWAKSVPKDLEIWIHAFLGRSVVEAVIGAVGKHRIKAIVNIRNSEFFTPEIVKKLKKMSEELGVGWVEL